VLITGRYTAIIAKVMYEGVYRDEMQTNLLVMLIHTRDSGYPKLESFYSLPMPMNISD